MTPLFSIVLTIPPSANSLFTNKADGGRSISKKYDSWQRVAGTDIRRQLYKVLGWHTIQCPVFVLLAAQRPRVDRDVDNIIKPTLDLLVDQKVLVDDTLVAGVAACWEPKEGLSKDCRMKVNVFAATEVPAISFQPKTEMGSEGGWEPLTPPTLTEA